jgi:hypothetical protein
MTNETSAARKPIYELPRYYLDSKHWIRGPKGKSGVKTDKLIYMAVGHALSNWEHVESAAAVLFSHFVDSNTIAAIRAYGTINGSRARQAAIREAAETFFVLRKAFNKKDRKLHTELATAQKCAEVLIQSYGTASARRTDIAHGIAQELSFKEQKDQSWFLVAPNYQSPKTANWIEDDFKLRAATGLRLSDAKARFAFNKMYYKNSEYVFGMNEIKVFAGKFAYLYAALLSFAHVLDPNKFRLTPAQLSQLAKHLSA